MISIEIPKITLSTVRLQTIVFGTNRDQRDPFANVDNMLLEDGSNFLLEDGGCILITD